MKELIWKYLNTKFPDNLKIETHTTLTGSPYLQISHNEINIGILKNGEYSPSIMLSRELGSWFDLELEKSKSIVVEWVEDKINQPLT